MTKTFGSKRPAVDLSLTVVFLLKKELNQWINATMSLYSIIESKSKMYIHKFVISCADHTLSTIVMIKSP